MTPKPQWEIECKEILRTVWEKLPDDLTLKEYFYSTQIEPHILSAIYQSYQQGVEDMRRKCVENIQEFLLSEMRGNNKTEMQEFEIACDDIIKLILHVDNPVDSPTQPDTMSR